MMYSNSCNPGDILKTWKKQGTKEMSSMVKQTKH